MYFPLLFTGRWASILLLLSWVVSFELDPSSSVTEVWEIGCSSATGHPIILLPCVRVAKMSFYEDLVAFWCWNGPVLSWSLTNLGKNRQK